MGVLILFIFLSWRSPGIFASHPWIEASLVRARGGGHANADDEVERRWQSLIDYCGGNWSGSIGWYDANTCSSDDDDDTLVPRADNHMRNMRLSFHPKPSSSESANWIVYHAHGQGVKEEVVLEKHGSSKDNLQTFYYFERGILGRTGNVFSVLPVIEHGFWDEGTRKTLVVVYDKDSRRLQKICFLQQIKKDESDFDVSASDLKDVSILPKAPTENLEQLQSSWKSFRLQKAESISFDGIRQDAVENDSLAQLLGGNDKMLRIVLPNNVVLACPWSFQDKGTFQILMGSKTKSGEVQVVDFLFENAAFRNITASYWI